MIRNERKTENKRQRVYVVQLYTVRKYCNGLSAGELERRSVISGGFSRSRTLYKIHIHIVENQCKIYIFDHLTPPPRDFGPTDIDT